MQMSIFYNMSYYCVTTVASMLLVAITKEGTLFPLFFLQQIKLVSFLAVALWQCRDFLCQTNLRADGAALFYRQGEILCQEQASVNCSMQWQG